MNRNKPQNARFLKRIKNDEDGAIGIGTLIVFIAMVLVAAIAAAVLIDTAGNLQSRAKRTGEDAVDDVSGGIQVLAVEGQYDDASGEIDVIKVYMVLYSGTEPVNVGRVGAMAGNLAIYAAVSDTTDEESGSAVYVADATDTDSLAWAADEIIIDPHGQYNDNGILDQDSIITVSFAVPEAITLAPRSSVQMRFMVGAGGTPTVSTAFTPGIYSAQDNDWIELE